MPVLGLLILWSVSAADGAPTRAKLAEDAAAHVRDGLAHPAGSAEARAAFRSAANEYEQLGEQGADNPELDRARGNAWLLAGDPARAILAYRRGLRFAPSDPGLREGLGFARGLVADASGNALGRPPIEQRPPWLPRLASRWYLLLATAAWSAGWVAAARWWMTRRGRLLGLAALGVCAALLLIAGLFAEERRDRDFVERPVVVLADDGVLLRSGNGLRYPPRFETPLHRGVEARLLFTRGDWLQIELAGGEVGWIPRDYALVDDTQ